MNRKSIKRRWLKTKIALNDTIQKILDINRKRKHLASIPEETQVAGNLGDELKLLNALADQQAKLLKRYEEKIIEEAPV